MSNFYGLAISAAAHELSRMDREQLESALLEIYGKLYCDNEGNFAPEESVAALDGGGDFVEACGFTFQRMKLK